MYIKLISFYSFNYLFLFFYFIYFIRFKSKKKFNRNYIQSKMRLQRLIGIPCVKYFVQRSDDKVGQYLIDVQIRP